MRLQDRKFIHLYVCIYISYYDTVLSQSINGKSGGVFNESESNSLCLQEVTHLSSSDSELDDEQPQAEIISHALIAEHGYFFSIAIYSWGWICEGNISILTELCPKLGNPKWKSKTAIGRSQ